MTAELIEEVRAWVDLADRVTALVGAGISTDSGIPDYRGPNGTWTKNPQAERMATLDYYLGDPDLRRRSWRSRLSSPIFDAQPNAGHHALVELERRGKLRAVITQNVDGLHLKAGHDPDKVIEVHGTAHRVVCWSCGETAPMKRALERVRAGEEDPPCRTCGGILKSATVHFGQQLDPTDIARAEAASRDCDLFLAIGSTLTVYPAAAFVPTALDAGARLVVINNDPTPFDRFAHAVIHDSISDVLPRIARSRANDLGAQPH